MATVVVGCMCMQSTIAEETCVMQIQPKGDLLPELVANIMLPWQLY